MEECVATLADMPCLVCIYNEHEGGYLTVGRTYQAVGVDEDGWKIRDDSGDYNVYSDVYLMEYES